MTENKEKSFCKEMRLATRDIHKISDSLINAKLIFALGDNVVWAQGLMLFYDIFKYLEENVPPTFLPPEYYRKEAFDRDLSFYVGVDWSSCVVVKLKPEVQNYIDHLEKLKNENPVLLVAYVYHLYMGLLSGAQILQKKRALGKKFNPFLRHDPYTLLGEEVTHFENASIFELKKNMKSLIDKEAESFDEETKRRLIEESRKVFELNNAMVKTLPGVNKICVKQISVCFLFVLMAFLMYKNIIPIRQLF